MEYYEHDLSMTKPARKLQQGTEVLEHTAQITYFQG